MTLSSILEENRIAFLDLCKSHKVKELYIFGSAVTDHFNPLKSDIDVLVELTLTDPVEYGETLISLWDSLESFFDRKVDLLTNQSLKNPYLKKSIESTKKLIYDGQSEEIFV